ncbi:hypothetical protein [Flavobacterium sp. N2550]|uniref:hypothetical protein n=1 Tax=Flavobacterium sp. N2550 TaxID=2986833 RepID=UPI002224A22D|nr:hypothetical protein [Flavobacterium sp. N2550]
MHNKSFYFIYLIEYKVVVLIFNLIIMGLFGKKEKKIFKEFSKKSVEYLTDINKDTDELLEELQESYSENRFAIPEFISLIESIKAKISLEESQKLEELSQKIVQIKKCAKKSVSAVAELSRNQRKTTREAIREFSEFVES